MSEKVKVEEKEVKVENIIDTTKMNIFLKLQNVRYELQLKPIVKSARNDFSKYNYFELSDFLPSINELCLKYHIFTYCDINSDLARITAVDCDNQDEIFTLTMDSAEVDLKGMNKVQGIGSQNTYMRRYLYMALFEISETDVIDAVTGKEEKPTTKGKKETKEPVEKDSKTTMKELCTSLSSNGHKDAVMEVLQRLGGVKNPNSISDVTKIEQIIKELEAL